MQRHLADILANLDGALRPIRESVERLLPDSPEPEHQEGALLISPRPKIAPRASACVLFAGLSEAMINRYLDLCQRQHPSPRFRIPQTYHQILRRLNGAELFQLSLYGVPPSMCSDPPLLDRGARQPLDLGTANVNWSRQYDPEPSQFHFGGSPYSWDENLGYFLNQDDTIEARRAGGSVFARWQTMRDFLVDEIARNEAAFPEYEERTGAFRAELEAAEAATKAARRSSKNRK